MTNRRWPIFALLLFIGTNPSTSQESGRPNRDPRRRIAVLNEQVDIRWTGPDDRYAWYEAQRGDHQTEIVVIDMVSGERLLPRDFPDGIPKPSPAGTSGVIELGALTGVERSKNGGAETEIEFINQSMSDVELKWIDQAGKQHSYGILVRGGHRRQHTFVNHVWAICDSNGDVLAATRSESHTAAVFKFDPESMAIKPLQVAPRRRERSQRDERSQAIFIKEFNLWARDPETNQESAITTDGNDQCGYEHPLRWSPSGGHFAVMRTRFVKPRNVTLIDSAPAEQVQPKTVVIDYAKPGDPLDHPQLCVFDAAGNQQHQLDESLTPTPFAFRDLSWRSDGNAVRLVYNERGHQRLQVIELNLEDGLSRVIVDEQCNTFIDYAGKYFLRFLDDTDELIWMSERDGWNHLYLIDQSTGNVIRQLTSGQWAVREVVDVDEAGRTMLVAAGGVVGGEDPYYLHLLRVSLDGGEVIKLTDGNGTHQWKLSPTNRYFSDCRSRVDLPPETVIRSLETGTLIAPAEVADISDLVASGWTMPQPFVAKGRDGVTDIHGVIIYPRNFDKRQTYPVLEMIYAGPHAAHVPKSFQRLPDLHQAADGLGGKPFIVVRIDAMGTSHRSKAFHDVCWKNLGDGGFPDRILWMKAAATTVPQMDLQRVGIWGGSAGGQNAVRALVAHGDFYQAAFSDCGCHDNRMDKMWWNELWMGWPVGPHYEEQSNVAQAHRITGKLMLSVGELDTNVDPASTLQLVDALIKADKDFELLFFPGAGHGVGSGEYGTRRRMDFFHRAFYPPH